jgi:hypothetical protein
MFRKLLLALMALSFVPVTGCRTLSKDLADTFMQRPAQREGRSRHVQGMKLVLRLGAMEKINFGGLVAIDKVQVMYQQGLDAEAECLVKNLNEVLDGVEEKTGVSVSCRPKLYLLRVDERPQNFNIQLKSSPRQYECPLFVEAADQSCKSIIQQNYSYPGLITHELIEMSLVTREQGRVLGELRGGWLLLGGSIRNYTRWFREGLAEYGSYLACEILFENENIAANKVGDAQYIHIHKRPFSALSKVGGKLFRWHQNSAARFNTDYYNAALGLFLLVADRFGEDAIRRVMRRIDEHDRLDGADLIEIFEQTLGADIRKLAEDFHFPETGLTVYPLTPARALNVGLEPKRGLYVDAVEPNSPSGDAGFREEDVILSIEDRPIGDWLDYEQALYHLTDSRAVDVLVYRKDEGRITIELPLSRGSQAGTD